MNLGVSNASGAQNWRIGALRSRCLMEDKTDLEPLLDQIRALSDLDIVRFLSYIAAELWKQERPRANSERAKGKGKGRSHCRHGPCLTWDREGKVHPNLWGLLEEIDWTQNSLAVLVHSAEEVEKLMGRIWLYERPSSGWKSWMPPRLSQHASNEKTADVNNTLLSEAVYKSKYPWSMRCRGATDQACGTGDWRCWCSSSAVAEQTSDPESTSECAGLIQSDRIAGVSPWKSSASVLSDDRAHEDCGHTMPAVFSQLCELMEWWRPLIKLDRRQGWRPPPSWTMWHGIYLRPFTRLQLSFHHTIAFKAIDSAIHFRRLLTYSPVLVFPCQISFPRPFLQGHLCETSCFPECFYTITKQPFKTGPMTFVRFFFVNLT